MFALSQLHGFNAVQATCDPYWDNVVSLLRVLEENGSATVTDYKGLTWTTVGSTGSVEVQSGAIEITANGVDNKYLYVADASLVMGTGDFTYEVVFSTNTIEYQNYVVRLSSSLLVRVSGNGSGYLQGLETLGFHTLLHDFANDVDYYLVIKRSSGVIHIELDGVELDSYAYANYISINEILLGPIAYVGHGTEKIKIKAFRVTKGIARPLSATPGLPLPFGMC